MSNCNYETCACKEGLTTSPRWYHKVFYSFFFVKNWLKREWIRRHILD